MFPATSAESKTMPTIANAQEKKKKKKICSTNDTAPST